MKAAASRDSIRAKTPIFDPKLLTVLKEGYNGAGFRADLLAGLTVAVVALPLSMAIAIASGVSPDRGITTAIIGGFLVSALGGSRFQIGGPAGAFIVLVAACVMRNGVEGMILATALSGLMLAGLGAARMGRFIRYVPYPVTLGFTAGIGAIILVSQITPLFGLRLAGPEPGPLIEKTPALWAALPSLNPVSLSLGLAVAALIAIIRHFRPALPGMLIAVALAALATWALALPVATIGSQYGGITQGLPMPSLPAVSPALFWAVLPDAVAFTLLGAIESLLSAVVADSLSGRRHRPDTELIAQGIANIGSSLFGGLPVTGTIARTATNVRARAHGPVAGMIHALTLLAFVLILAPLAAFIPLAALAGVLVSVALHMIDAGVLFRFLATARGEAVVLLATFGFTLFRDLMSGIIVGTALGSVLIVQRMSRLTSVTSEGLPETPYDTNDAETVTLRVTGAFFFGSAPIIEQALDRIGSRPRHLILDVSAVPIIDTSGGQSLARIAERSLDLGAEVSVVGANAAVRSGLALAGLSPRVTVSGLKTGSD